jgi:nucleoside-diphosphate-sugar epimerase
MKKFEVLLIGGTGFIGEYLLKELSKTRTAVFHSGKNTYVSSPNVFYFCDDNGEFFFDEMVRQVSKIVFLAQPDKTLLNRVLSAIGDDDKKALLYASTLMLYKGGKRPQRETDELLPITSYAKQKYEEEQILGKFSESRKNIKIIIARLGNVYGDVKNKGIIGIVFDSLFKKGKEIILSGDGLQVRDFIIVDDVAKTLALLLKTTKKRLDIVNVTTGKGHTILEVIKKIEKITGKKVSYRFGPVSEETFSIIGDTQKLESLIGTRGTMTLDEGLHLTHKRYMMKST